MPDRIRIYPECNADTALFTLLFPEKDLIDHASGIHEVSKSLENVKSDATILLGIIDNDERKPRYVDQFELVENMNKVAHYIKPNSNQHLLVIDKAIESFLLWNAAQVGIDLATYGFPTDVRKLGKKYLKKDIIQEDKNFLQLLTDLYARQAPGFVTLKRILDDLIAT